MSHEAFNGDTHSGVRCPNMINSAYRCKRHPEVLFDPEMTVDEWVLIDDPGESLIVGATAGPWREHNGGVMAGDNVIATVRVGQSTWQERRANAELMAAAPEMLATLQRIIQLLWSPCTCEDSADKWFMASKAQEVIQRALGGSR